MSQFLTWSNDQWRKYINDASKMEIDAILEKAKRINEFHEEFINNKPKFGTIWRNSCEEVLGISQITCDRYIKIYQNLSLQKLIEIKQYLPTSISSLVAIANASEIHPDIISEAIKNKIISPNMTSEIANSLIIQAKDNVRHDAIQMIEGGYNDEYIINKLNINQSDIPQLREVFESKKKHEAYNLWKIKIFKILSDINKELDRSVIDNILKEWLGQNPKGVL